ncbi:GntR family transcriptional regulator [Polymorphum gilvum]|uniref:Transcriptional regulator, GntR family n=1 Tax=Polymorphum gilvum (strain LMG 25793 / CGMCC 1.9160 / SL003B-26A1) TaxID=991905 RepID=F2J4D0_POLGS|nr:GntR family transcriptional regulator [Polymorphum gilvum]ADZ71072.1 Transcriptional regulator, GntR family [Polymorphum gilvum SL003B-26A1]
MVNSDTLIPRREKRGGPARERFERLYEILRRRICLLDYPPGMRLGEEGLAAEFGVSRTPLRKVLARLESDGLLQSIQGVGTIVTDVDLDALAQVYQLRMELNELIGRLSPVPPNAETLERLRALHRRSRDLAADPRPRAFAELNIDFFHAVMRLTDNAPLRDISERLFYQTSRIWLKYLPKMDTAAEVEVFSREIADILAAAELGDLEAAGHIRRSHISMSFTRLKRVAQAG